MWIGIGGLHGAKRALGRWASVLVCAGLVAAMSACGSGGPPDTPDFSANSQGGSKSLGAQDKVGLATKGDCIGVDENETDYYYCGKYAKQWCKDNPPDVPFAPKPFAGSCKGIPGWSSASSGSNSPSNSAPSGGSNPPSNAAPAGGANSGAGAGPTNSGNTGSGNGASSSSSMSGNTGCNCNSGSNTGAGAPSGNGARSMPSGNS